ncbi:MAG: hypothetical protein [Olavius algarvensis Gamma 1 endosymbiont]|nr:MAG: hypothetical protein [Olavius algarvensis Gamma 1 endosymbiont]
MKVSLSARASLGPPGRAHINRVVPVDNFLIYKNIIRLDRPN